MKKPITLQYTIDEDQLPNETARLLGSSLSRLTSIVATAPETCDIMSIKTIDDIGGLRQELSAIDIMLGDVSSIIDQYIKYQYQMRMEYESGESEDVEEYEYDIPDFSDADLSNVSMEDVQSMLSKTQGHSHAGPELLDDIKTIVPNLKTKKVKSPAMDAEARQEQVNIVTDQMTKAKQFQTAIQDLGQDDALTILSKFNDIDFTDVATVGDQLKNIGINVSILILNSLSFLSK